MTSDGMAINVRTVERYLEGFMESFFLYKTSRYDIKEKQYLKTGEKYYISDLGLRYFMLGRKIGDRGHILENVIYLELLRRGYDVYIGKINDNYGKIILTLDKMPLSNENGIIIRNVLDWLIDK